MDVLWEDLSFETILKKKQRKTSRNFPFYVFILYSLSIFSDYKLHIKENAKKEDFWQNICSSRTRGEKEVEVENNKIIKSERTT